MAEAETKVPVKREQRGGGLQEWRPFLDMRREMSRMFDEFERNFFRLPFPRSAFDFEALLPRQNEFITAPAVDISEKDGSYEIAAELPGMDEKDIELKLTGNTLTIRGEKKEEKEEKEKNYYLSERRYGSFERAFRLPEGVDRDKISAAFKKGVLTVTLPKTAEAQKAEKKIEVKAD